MWCEYFQAWQILSCLGLRGLTCCKIWDPDSCIIEWDNNPRNSLDTCMTAVRQLIVESNINFQGYHKALWELTAFQKRQNPKTGDLEAWALPADLLVIGEHSKQPSNPADRKWRCLQISKCTYQALQLCNRYGYFPIPLCPRLMKQCHFSHPENHNLPLISDLGMWM